LILGADDKFSLNLAKSPDKTTENFSDKTSDNVKELKTQHFYEFSEFRLDTKKLRLLKAEEIISLTPKEFELLLLLIKNAGKVLEKDELMEAIWGDTFVEEATLTRNISWLRKKLAVNSTKEVKFIETIPKRGYRFLPNVTEIENSKEFIANLIERNPTNFIADLPKENIENLAASDSPNSWQNSRRWLLGAGGILAVIILGLIIYQSFIKESDSKTLFVANIKPFSGLAGQETMPAFSPDGKFMTFVWNGGNESDNFDIYVKLIGAGEPIRLTKNLANDLNPAFSPDGKSIAFVRSSPTSSELFLISAFGGTERKVCNLYSIRSSLSFTPDGKTIAVADSDAVNQSSGIFFVDLETGAKTRVTTPPEYNSDDTPIFSADGRKVFFTRAIGTTVQEIFGLDINTKDLRQLTFDKSRIRGLAWYRDKILFTSQRSGSQLNLWEISVNGGEPGLIATSAKNPVLPAVSGDGKMLAFVEETNDTNIWEISGGEFVDSSKLNAKSAVRNSALTATKLIASSRAEHSPHYSPNAGKIIFASDRTGKYEIWSANTDGTNQSQLTDSPNSAGSPRFSPDGKLIAYDAQIEGNGDIFIISAEGGKPQNLTATKEIREVLPTWSSDGRFIFFCSNRSGDYQLWKISIEGGEPQQLTQEGAFESFAIPNGQEVFYTKTRGLTGIWKVSTNGGEESLVEGLADAGYWRFWTATTNGIYFVSQATNPPYSIKFYDFATQTTVQIGYTDKTPIWLFSGFAAAPDGRKFLFAQNDLNAATIMIADL
jgi:Tol biopolymer transport system component/DNA-binding winged helix-turn-helix (wHTH) protein